MKHTVTVDLFGKQVSFETGKWAKQANGSVVVRQADNVVLVTACGGMKPKPGASFFPLTVDYREYTYAAGRYPGGFIKREGRPSEKEVLTCRMIDRPIRPLFPSGYRRNETQIIALVVSADPEFDPAPLAMSGATAALAISEIPFPYVLAGTRVALLNGKLIALPTFEEAKAAEFFINISGNKDGLVMVEAGGKGADESDVLKLIEFGQECCGILAKGIGELQQKAGKTKWICPDPVVDAVKAATVEKAIRAELTDAIDTKKYGKMESYAKIDEVKAKAVALFTEEADQAEAKGIFDSLKEKIFRDEMLEKRRRPDGRAFDELRHIECEVGVLPRTHGSALFTRGETQALVTVTLGTKDDEQRIELLDKAESSKRFMLHYNFPPFSVGETGRSGSPGRREMGHGNLAERAVQAAAPAASDFPYTIRIVSDILESNGSSSMASVCGGSLALMDAGVKMAAPVAGIAMGLVLEGDKYAILTDIAGAEDHYGDMDFKVAGTKDKVTALQMDLKVTNVKLGMMKEALAQAKKARLEILEVMNKAIEVPRDDLSKYAPRIYTVMIPVDKIRELIGPGGKMIRSIVDSTGCKIDVSDDGQVNVFATDGESAKKALAIIEGIAAVPEVGKTYLGTVTRIADFGAFVEIMPGLDGLLHISEISESRVKEVRDELNEGDQVRVKVLALEGNKVKLSRKAVLKEMRESIASGKN